MKSPGNFYQFLNSFKHHLLFSLFGYSPACHQNPSCSEYTALQIKKNGTIVGLLRGLWRVLHCK